MHIAAVIAFIIGAIIGIVMAVAHFRKVSLGMPIGLAHGFFTVSGVVLLIVGLLYSGIDAWAALWAFVATAVGGVYLFYRQATGKGWPSAVVLIHGAAGIASIAFLIALLSTRPAAGRDSEPGVPAVTPGADGASTATRQ